MKLNNILLHIRNIYSLVFLIVMMIKGIWALFSLLFIFKYIYLNAEPAPQGQFETSQLELSLKSHAFEKFVYLQNTLISPVPRTQIWKKYSLDFFFFQ